MIVHVIPPFGLQVYELQSVLEEARAKIATLKWVGAHHLLSLAAFCLFTVFY